MLGTAVVEGDPALNHVTDQDSGITRKRRGKQTRYLDARGRIVRDLDPDAIDVDTLRAIETVVARYVVPQRRRRQA